jgi:hypothetical protein
VSAGIKPPADNRAGTFQNTTTVGCTPVLLISTRLKLKKNLPLDSIHMPANTSFSFDIYIYIFSPLFHPADTDIIFSKELLINAFFISKNTKLCMNLERVH